MLLSVPVLYDLSHGCPQAYADIVAPMEYAKLEVAALAHVDDSYYYGRFAANSNTLRASR